MLRKFWSKDGRSAIAYPDWPILASFPTIFLFIIFALSHVGSHVNLAKFWLFSRFSSTFPALELAGKFQNKIIYIIYFETFNRGLQEFCLKTDYNCKVRKQYVKQWVEMFFEVTLKFFLAVSRTRTNYFQTFQCETPCMSNFLIFERIENDTYPEIVNEK